MTARTTTTARAVTAGAVMLGWVALLWVLEGIDTLTGHQLDTYGVSPREASELRDVVPSAFLHAGWEHVASNSLPLLVLGFIAALAGLRRFAAVVLTVIVTAGLGVWFTAPAGTVTLGASGVVFGLFGYLLVRGFVDRRPLDVVVGLVVAALYGSILWGVLPTDSGISWQGHLFGLLGGVLSAFLYRRPRRPVTGPHVTV
ncbi:MULTISPECIES: rhomboid family intramembrane serine protease [unclassified Streptomyces]|uniref:rhomboid family intramembrane serine protease n=1 Tax=Streptomyces TaxID=1883 RepID=UPI0001C19E77|nr:MULTISPECIES: rhomboid family intramembrane serine protease [unclassified Streptomyces]AEN10601.1 Rhomboid family protein [Streptomyces sp. SirexAA-E]MYR68880.1 rhomboid family intramembrane serine protease [Streptomyces sp. SID4939]MYS02904.1 rhomboid family intramembrane serine protease [Streptomyces sp. SID4940]MYT62209.1 rhomboid family intramembrane serine protease [Streptomyces sp. SID8357]MYT83995.1 rhomboid family intramembrane serine protease [Streptomyces sp. SID8360]